MANGYMGKFLWVDLTKKTLKEEFYDEQFCRDWIGGYGLGARIIYTHQKGGVDPLGPDAILGILTGPATGTPFIGGSRYVVVGKSPLTGGWGDANSGGMFGPNMKFAGYDGVFFRGISDKPVYIYLESGKAEIRDATYLWGKDTNETEDMLRAKLGNDTEVACIGPAGEKLALVAAVMNNKGRAAGRSGLGAVMGSKKVKAVAVKGKGGSVPVFDPELSKKYRKEYLTQLTGHYQSIKQFGTPGIMAMMAKFGDSPVKNWASTAVLDFPNPEIISDKNVTVEQDKRYACYMCPIGCGGHMKAFSGPDFSYAAGAHKPEYETLAMFGSNVLNGDLHSIVKCNDICNRYGLDTIGAGGAIGFTVDCYENGLITKADTGGLEMKWGNSAAIVAMTEKLAKREGFGNVIADGVKRAAERIGKGADKLAMHIGGAEYPAHDAKFGFHWAITYRMDATPGRHTQGQPGGPTFPIPPIADRKAQLGRQPGHVMGQAIGHYIQSLGLCTFVYGALPSPESIYNMVKAVTGWDINLEEIIKVGTRIHNQRHCFNLREGISPLHYHHPDRMAGIPARTAGPLKGITLDEPAMLKEYFQAMDWDMATAKPSVKSLIDQGLEDVARDLYK
jgi:aldehyde:ferredoxin oxidoreductase